MVFRRHSTNYEVNLISYVSYLGGGSGVNVGLYSKESERRQLGHGASAVQQQLRWSSFPLSVSSGRGLLFPHPRQKAVEFGSMHQGRLDTLVIFTPQVVPARPLAELFSSTGSTLHRHHWDDAGDRIGERSPTGFLVQGRFRTSTEDWRMVIGEEDLGCKDLNILIHSLDGLEIPP